MSTTLVLGANTVIEQTPCTVAFSTQQQVTGGNALLQFGEHLGLLWLPLDEHRKAVCSPAYLHEPKAWATLNEASTPNQWQLDLAHLFDTQNMHYLQLIAYAYSEPHLQNQLGMPLVEIDDIRLSLNNDAILYHFKATERHVKAVIVLEIYKRGGQYKCRALGETSLQGVDSLQSRVQISLDTRLPSTHRLIQEAQSQQGQQGHPAVQPNRPPRQVQAGETWTGTAFAIDAYHLLTCYHVIESAALVGIRQQGQIDREAQVVMSDIGSDTAIIKVSEPLPCYLPLAQMSTDLLGETITTLGYPLSGLSQQLQVTQGCISGLTGLGDDIRYLQFTAPIQPGSSGSPLLLPTGEVIGMVTASLVHEHAQNMNYAVKYQLLSALLTSAGIVCDSPSSTNMQTSNQPLSTPQLSRQSKAALWLVGCQG